MVATARSLSAGGGGSDGGDALFLCCGGSGDSLSLRVDDSLEALFLGGG